ncbi:MAG TPA: glycosyltransferase [Holophagaceae bacterium]
MPTLSLAMIVKNEAKNLGHCLASVKGLVDEMVVVDTGSTDGTVALAEGFGARIGHFPWTGDFAAARNESLRLCTGDWILVLDADEAVDALDHPKIREAISQEAIAAYDLVSRNYSETPGSVLLDQVVVPNTTGYVEGAQFPYYADAPNLRLMRRYPDLQYEGRIHEVLVPYFLRRGLAIGALDAVVHHYGKVDYERERQKLAFYLDLAEKDAAAHPLNEQCQFNLMLQAYAAGQWSTSVRAGAAFARLKAQVPLVVYTTVGMAHQKLGAHASAVTCFETVLKYHPDHALSLQRLAISLLELRRADEARRHLETALATNPQFGPAHFAVALVEETTGRIPEARAALQRGLQQLPDHERMHFALIQLDLRHHLEAQAASDAWASLSVLPRGGGGHWHALVAAFLLKEGHGDQGRAVLRQGLSLFPEHPGLKRLLTLAEG